MRTETAWLCSSSSRIRVVQRCVLFLPSSQQTLPLHLTSGGRRRTWRRRWEKSSSLLTQRNPPGRLRPLDHRSSKTRGWYRKALNLVSSFADGARGSADERAEVLVQHFAPRRAVESTGRGTASSTLGHAILRASPYPSYGPYVQQSHPPVGPKPFQKTFMRLKAFEDRRAAIFNKKCHAQWWKEFHGKFIHNYSCLTEKEMRSVIFWLPECCSCIKKRDLPSSRGFTGSSHRFTFCFEQHPNWIQYLWSSS